MKLTRYSFPHPVLNWNDDVEGVFEVLFKHTATRDKYILNATFKLQNQSLEELLAAKSVSFLVHVECPQTFFRQSYPSFENPQVIEVDSELLRDKTTVTFYLCAVQDISTYQVTGAHPDYSNTAFQIEKGTIVGYGGKTAFLAEKQYDSLSAVSSIMMIIEGKHNSSPMLVDFSGSKIIIELSKKDFEEYNIRKSDRTIAPIFHSTIVLPVLIEALRKVNDPSKYGDTKWFQVLQKKMTDNSYSSDEEDLFDVAQKILENPLTRTLEAINNLENNAGDFDENTPKDI